MLRYCSNKVGLRLGRKRRHESLDRRCLNKEWQRLMERTNDLYEVREEEFVRVLWRDRGGLYHNFTISANKPLNDEEVVALAIREYGLPGRECVVEVQHVWHQYIADCSNDETEPSYPLSTKFNVQPTNL